MNDLDSALCEHFDQRFFAGSTSDEGAKLLAGIIFYDICFYTISALPRTTRALRGSTNTGPAEQRLPFPVVLLHALAAHLVCSGEIDKVVCLLTQHNAY